MIGPNVNGARPQPPLAAPPFQTWHINGDEVWAQFFRQDTGYVVRFPDLADFHLSRDGSSVDCWGVPGVGDATIEHLFLNQIVPLALNCQGRLVLHGSAVECDGGALAFLGPSGRGKSTLAAAFAKAGHRLLTDDGLLLEERGDAWFAHPSHPSLRLWADSEEALVLSDSAKAAAVDYTDKARFLAGDDIACCEGPRPLLRFYVLGDADVDEPAFTRLSPRDCVMQFVQNSFVLDVEEPGTLARHFDELVRLSAATGAWRLDFPRDYAQLAQLRRAILDHAAA